MNNDASIKLSNGVSMPLIGLGTWKSSQGDVGAAVKHALQIGYRHLDCSVAYENEAEVGAALAESIQSGVVEREEVFVTAKCWCANHSKAKAREGLMATLKDLRLAYLDLYLIHWPMGFKEGGELFPKDENGKLLSSDVDYFETWEAMEAFYKEGLVKAIGLSNFNSQQITRILEKGCVKPVVHQIEIHPYFVNSKMVEFCESRDIAVTAYSPLGSRDRPWAKPDDPSLIDEPEIKAIAEKYDKTPAQVLLRFALERNIVVIPKSVNLKRIEENFNVFDFRLDEEDMKSLYSFDRPDGRVLFAPWCSHLPHFPFAPGIEF